MDLYNQQLVSQLHRQAASNGGHPEPGRREETDGDGRRSPAFTHVRPEEDAAAGEDHFDSLHPNELAIFSSGFAKNQ